MAKLLLLYTFRWPAAICFFLYRCTSTPSPLKRLPPWPCRAMQTMRRVSHRETLPWRPPQRTIASGSGNGRTWRPPWTISPGMSRIRRQQNRLCHAFYQWWKPPVSMHENDPGGIRIAAPQLIESENALEVILADDHSFKKFVLVCAQHTFFELFIFRLLVPVYYL